MAMYNISKYQNGVDVTVLKYYKMSTLTLHNLLLIIAKDDVTTPLDN